MCEILCINKDTLKLAPDFAAGARPASGYTTRFAWTPWLIRLALLGLLGLYQDVVCHPKWQASFSLVGVRNSLQKCWFRKFLLSFTLLSRWNVIHVVCYYSAKNESNQENKSICINLSQKESRWVKTSQNKSKLDTHKNRAQGNRKTL